MSKFRRAIMACIAVALVAYFAFFIFRTLDTDALLSALSSPRQLTAVVVAALAYAMIIPITAWAWRKLLAVQSEDWQVRDLSSFLALSQLAKYIPGNVAQHATRAAFSIHAGMRKRPYFTSIAHETLLTVAASLLVGTTMLALSKAGLARLSPASFFSLILVGTGSIVAVVALASIRLTPELLLGHRSRWIRIIGHLGGLPGPRASLGALAAYTTNFLIIGLGLFGIARAVGLPLEIDYMLVTATFALSWTLGFLAPGAPAGLGVREGIMLLLLQGSATDEGILIFVLLSRLCTVLGDTFCFLVASFAAADK